MTISSFYHTQGVRGYNYQKIVRSDDSEIYFLYSATKSTQWHQRKSHQTSLVKKGSGAIFKDFVLVLKTILRVVMRRINCRDCGGSIQEAIS